MIELDRVKSMYLLGKKGLEGLESERARLDGKRKLLEDYKKQEPAFLNTLDTLAQTRQQRDELLSNLRTIAEERISSDPFDVSARYCLYLLTSLTENEQLNETLEDRWIKSSCGKELTEPEESDYRLPSDIESVTEEFRELKRIVGQTDRNRSICKATRDRRKVKLAHAREKFTKGSRVTPSHERSFREKLAELDAEIESIASSRENLETRKERCDKRCTLIHDLFGEIDKAMKGFPVGTTYQMLHSVKAILNSVDNDTDMFMAHSRGLVGMASGKPVRMTTETPRQLGDIAERSRQIREMISALPTSPRSSRRV